MKKRIVFSISLLTLLLLVSRASLYSQEISTDSSLYAKAPVHIFELKGTYPHLRSSFTEGIILQDGVLYESSGLYGASFIFKSELVSGKMIKKTKLTSQFFAEGITIIGDEVFQLTYKEQTILVYDKNTLALKATHHYAGDGWGLTTDGQYLIISDGTAILHYLDPHSLKVVSNVVVHEDNRQISNLNSLAMIKGRIYANVYPSDNIVIISPQDGRVEGWLNISSLNHRATEDIIAGTHVANGIAYNPQDDTILVTGKFWSHIYAISITG